MDCNSYSYTAPGFGVDNAAPVFEYRNDDMSALLDKWSNQYNALSNHPNNDKYIVSAWSVDGSMEIDEIFITLDAARALYDHIMANYTDTPPIKSEIRQVIRNCHWIDEIDPKCPIVKPVPARVKARCKWYMKTRFMGLYDAFNEAVREYPKPSKELKAAFMSSDYRAYIPSAYIQEG